MDDGKIGKFNNESDAFKNEFKEIFVGLLALINFLNLPLSFFLKQKVLTW